MKRLRILALEKDRSQLLDLLQRLGCVQIESQSAKIGDPEWGGLMGRSETALEETKAKASAVKNALEALSKYAGIKESMVKKLFTARPEMTLTELQKENFLSEMQTGAEEIIERSRRITELSAERGRTEARLAAFLPWRELDVPLDYQGSKVLSFCPGICPAAADTGELQRILREESSAAEAFLVSKTDTESYIAVLYHPGAEEETMNLLKSFGFSRMDFKDVSGTADQNIDLLRVKLREMEEEQEAAKAGLADYAPRVNDLRQALDALTVKIQREEAAERVAVCGSAFYLEGWAPEKVIPALEKILSRYEYAYESHAPEPGEEPPVLLQSSGRLKKMVESLSMVTGMYALPKYDNIDPNPLIAPFYILFFGMMYADVAYGLILAALGFLVTRKSHPKGMMGQAFRLMQYCGLSAVFFGFLFGGFFSDIVSVVGQTFFGASDAAGNPTWVFPTLWINPMDSENNGPMTVLVFSMVLGAIQIVAGMIIKMVIMIRDGHPVAAVLEVVPWWCFFVSIALTMLVGGAHWIVGGLVLLVLTQGYAKKGIVKKLFGGVTKLYDITSYLSDVLSYSRLMALGLAGGVIGSVFNKLGAMPATIPVAGPVIFLIIFIAGHSFNFAINIIGTYVHAARLQYIEYFSKFYDSPGEPFKPLQAATKYVDIVERGDTPQKA
ncbi:MAG: V-type ATP synthase subunit I [Oscillospiraceae bacterium]|nr:V-type ATP synthase subunit I [Oscillospiraceae bacterium]